MRTCPRNGGVGMGDKNKPCSYYIEELCKKFRNRGIAEKVQTDATQAGTGRDGGSLPDKRYMSVTHNGKICMSSDDMARYYRDTRGYSTPHAEGRADKNTDIEDKGAQLQSKKELRLAIRKHIGSKLRAAGIIPPNPKRLIETVNEGFEADEPESRGYAEPKRIRRGVIPCILLVFVSLLLVVASSVMVSRAESERARLESQLKELTATEAKLKVDLEVKNNMVDMKQIAEGEYGMVGAEYVKSRYIDLQRDDRIDIGDGSGRKSTFETLLEALGLRTAD